MSAKPPVDMAIFVRHVRFGCQLRPPPCLWFHKADLVFALSHSPLSTPFESKNAVWIDIVALISDAWRYLFPSCSWKLNKTLRVVRQPQCDPPGRTLWVGKFHCDASAHRNDALLDTVFVFGAYWLVNVVGYVQIIMLEAQTGIAGLALRKECHKRDRSLVDGVDNLRHSTSSTNTTNPAWGTFTRKALETETQYRHNFTNLALRKVCAFSVVSLN